jgi:tetratricopeptide (TPR) repeat protein
MRIIITSLIVAMLTIILPIPGSASSPASRCENGDKVCREFEQLTEEQQPEKIIKQYEAGTGAELSAGSRFYIGGAYLALASGDNVSPGQEESYYWKALKLDYSVAYMGLYFFHVQKDEEKALGFLREYVKTKPEDTVPYVILGEADLNRHNYESADRYLREAKRVARAHSPRVDWLLFQANYLLKNYQFASEMFASAITKGKFENEIRALSSDPRFSEIGKLPEFQGLRKMLETAKSGN